MVVYTSYAILLSLFASGHVQGKRSCGIWDSDGNAALSQTACPVAPITSCGSYTGNSCCAEANGLFSLTVQWNWDKVVGGEKDWGIHGLWPDCCDLSFPASCDPSRARTQQAIIEILGTNAPEVLDYMSEFWQSYKKAGNFGRVRERIGEQWKKWTDKAKTTMGRPTDPRRVSSADATFWFHEWEKHGTCVTTLTPTCAGMPEFEGSDVVAYFTTATTLFKDIPTYEWFADANIEPGKSYQLSDMINALADKARWGAIPMITCDSNNRMQEIYYFFHATGSVRFGKIQPVDSPNQKCRLNQPVWYCIKGDKNCGKKSKRGGSSDEI